MKTATVTTLGTACVMLAFGASPARADDIPDYVPEAYCRLVAVGSGGPASLWDDCVERERLAHGRLVLAWDGVPTLVASRCDGIARSIGGSYDILEGCVRDEMGRLTDSNGTMS